MSDMQALTYNPQQNKWLRKTLKRPEPRAYDVLVKVISCGLNPVDAKIALWKNLAPDMDENWVAGLDIAGEVCAVGSAVTQWKVGNLVLTHGNMFRPYGGLAEYSLQDARTLIPHPKSSSKIAAATPCAGWTAWRALHDKLRINPHDRLLITGGAGGTGSFGLQIAKMAGVKMRIATTSSKNSEFVREMGATHVIDYQNSDLIAAINEITQGQGLTKGLDTVGGDNACKVANCLGFEGEMTELVEVLAPRDYDNSFSYGLSFHQISLGSGHRHGDAGRSTLTRTGMAFSKALEAGLISVPKLQVISLDAAATALEEMLLQRTVGKIVVNFS